MIDVGKKGMKSLGAGRHPKGPPLGAGAEPLFRLERGVSCNDRHNDIQRLGHHAGYSMEILSRMFMEDL